MPKKTFEITAEKPQVAEVGGSCRNAQGALEGVIYKGVLEKVVRHGFNSKKLCVLSESMFCHFTDKKAQGTMKQISLADIQAVKRDHSSKGYQFEIITQQRTETFAAPSLEVCEHWLRIIQTTLLNNRRNSSSQLSPVRKLPTHSYEEVDVDNRKQQAVEKPKVRRWNTTYETVDIGDENPSTLTPESGNRPTGGATADEGSHVLANSTTPKAQVQPTGNPLKIRSSEPLQVYNAYESVDINPEENPRLLTNQRSLCMTVDQLGGPSRPQCELPLSEDQNTPPIYSEALSKKKSDLYTEVKKIKATTSVAGNEPDYSPAEYSTAYSQIKYAQKPEVKKMSGSNEREERSVYCLAGDINGDKVINPQKDSPKESAATNTIFEEPEEIYEDAESVMAEKSLHSASDEPLPSPLQSKVDLADEIYDDAESCMRNDQGKIEDSISTASFSDSVFKTEYSDSARPFPSLKYGSVSRDPVITQLETVLASYRDVSAEYSTISQVRINEDEDRIKKLRSFLNEN